MSYRFYSFVNHLYMNEKQWGIQTAHCVSTMMSRTADHKDKDPESYQMLQDWAMNDPTIIMCQGGNVAMLTDLYTRLSPLVDVLNLPLVKFHEDQASLGGVITAVAVLVPDGLFDCYISDGYILDENNIKHPTFEHPLTGASYDHGTTEQEFLWIVKTARLA